MKPKLVVFTGAGISAESGIKTFRDSGGLWEQYDINEVATPQAWAKNPQLVLDFYNARRKQIIEATPNDAHKKLVELENDFDVHIITQNIDNLHERAGSQKVLHLHGDITQSRSTIDSSKIYPIKGFDIKMGDVCELGSQLRPHIVWFGELVPQMENACFIAEKADLFCVVGTSMAVYPAAGIIEFVGRGVQKYVIDPNDLTINNIPNLVFIKQKASVGLSTLASMLLK